MTDKEHAEKIHRLVRELRGAMEEAASAGMQLRLTSKDFEGSMGTSYTVNPRFLKADIVRVHDYPETFTEKEMPG